LELAIQIPDLKEIILIIISSLALSIGSFIIIRLGGKKSISQMTLPQMVIMIAMGSLITKPLNESKTIIGTLIAMIIFIGVLLLLEFISLKNDKAEPLLDSRPSLLIVDGKLQIEVLKELRMTVDQLESMLREKGISSFAELRNCTLEIDGKIGCEKVKDYKPYNDNLFDELRKGKHNKSVNPKLD
jgi:uncharacterized membrane protein YcaP (DUF421 family)